jgi:hypothetical protein
MEMMTDDPLCVLKPAFQLLIPVAAVVSVLILHLRVR